MLEEEYDAASRLRTLAVLYSPSAYTIRENLQVRKAAQSTHAVKLLWSDNKETLGDLTYEHVICKMLIE